MKRFLPEEMLGRIAVLAGIAAALTLLGMIVYGATTFGADPADEGYRRFLKIAGIALAMMIGVAAGAHGTWRDSAKTGFTTLGTALIFTAVAMSMSMPWVEYPGDRYAAGWVWVMNGILPLLVTWSAATILGRHATYVEPAGFEDPGTGMPTA